MVVLLATAVAIAAVPWHGSPPRPVVKISAEPSPPTSRWLADIEERLDTADIAIDAHAAIWLWMASSLAGVIAVVTLGGAESLVPVVFGAAVGAAIPAGWALSRGDRKSLRVMESLPEMLELLARSLRGGAGLHLALGDLAKSGNRAGQSLGPVLRRVEAGGRLGESLDQWVVELGHRDASVVRAVVLLGDSTGGSMAPALDRAAATIRERSALRDEIRALTSQSRASAMVIAASPVGFLAVVAVTDPKTSHVLFSTSIGRACLMGGLFLDGLGLLWMSRLTAGVER